MPLSDRDRRAVKIGGILAAVLIVALLGIGQLGKGGSDALPPLGAPSGSAVPTGPTGGPTVAPTVSPSGSVPPTTSPTPVGVFEGRDPFSPPPIFATATDGGTTSPTDGGTTSPTDGGTTSPTDGGTTSPPPTSPPTLPSDGASTTVGGHTVVILDTFTDGGQQMATIEVDGTVYHVAEGDTFAGGDFQLVDVSGNCAAMLFGDDSFTLCFDPEK
jgi:hypothetical protein